MLWGLIGRGLVVGLLAGLAAGAFAFVFGEPLLQSAIETEHSHAGDELVSRPAQRAGLFLATVLYGAAVGGLFAIVFATLRGRGGARTDRQLSARLAGALFMAVVLVPFVKYPANPPAVGDPGTIGDRTAAYLILLAGSLAALLAAARVMWSVRDGAPPWVRPLVGAGTFILLAGGLALALPGAEGAPPGFPASLLWEFRISSLGTQAVLWAVLGLGFGAAVRAPVNTGRPAAWLLTRCSAAAPEGQLDADRVGPAVAAVAGHVDAGEAVAVAGAAQLDVAGEASVAGEGEHLR
jgi:hypothetical protein